MGEIAEFGEKGFSGTFGWENNELHRRVYLRDAENQLLPLLQFLMGKSSGEMTPLAFPAPFDSFCFHGLNFELADEHGAQGSTDTPGDFSILNDFPTIAGGIVVDLAFRPQGQYGVIDEEFDYSGQVMSIIGNNYAQDKTVGLVWSSTGALVTNLSAITRVLPKVELRQPRWYIPDNPCDPNGPAAGLIGSINSAPFSLGAAGADDSIQWDAETVLLVGMPSLRRWRFDGGQIFEVGIKLAINTYQDTLADGTTGPVGWNRLYNVAAQHWDYVEFGSGTGKRLYPEVDMTQLNFIHPS